MTLEVLVIGAIRVFGSLPVLRWPFYGGLFALLVDQSDLLFMNLLDLGGIPDYQEFDKWADQVYLALFLIVALRWRGYERNVAIGLYAFRLVGFIAWEITGSRTVLLFFPNFFEFWFLFVAGRYQFGLEEKLQGWRMAYVLVPLFALKVFQEYGLHYGRWLDGITTLEAIEAIWDFLTPF